ncbi:MAG: prohibitin family protein [Chitinophagales bacterium]
MDPQKQFAKYAVIGTIIFIFLLLFTNSTFITIQAGEKGILFKKFSGGLDNTKDEVYGQGFHIVAPWNDMIVYDVREQIKEEKMDVLSSDGLPIEVDVSARYHPVGNKIGYLHNEIGKEYEDIVLKDVVRSAAREVMGKYTPEELYADKRDAVREEIEQIVRTQLEKKYLKLQAVNIRSIKLPKTIEDAIQTKLVQEQEKEQYQFRLEKETKEAERRKIEATGKAEANRIISESLTDKILREKGVEATLQLANSPNSKVVVIGSADSGLPLILGQ